MAIGLTHGGSNHYVSTKAATELLVGTKDGVVLMTRDALGAPWRIEHRALPGQFISSIIVERESGAIFAGAFFGTVSASTDGGRNWEQRSNGLTKDDIYSLASVKRKDGKVRVFCGTQPAHLFYSDDLGRNWAELPNMRNVPTVGKWSFPAPPHIAHTKFIVPDPKDSDTIFACIEQGALLKSTDGGQSFTEVNTLGFFKDKARPSTVFYDIHKLLVDPRDSKKMFVTGGAGLYVTFDGGDSWDRWMCDDWAADVYPDGLVFHPNNPDVMFVSAAEHNPATWQGSKFAGGKIYRSKDAGRTWEQLRNGLPDRMPHEVGALCIEDWGSGFSLYAATTGGEVYSSDDGGESWNKLASGLESVAKKGHDMLVQLVGSRS